MRLKELREEKNINQKVVADMLNISQQAYSRYETGEREPSIESLKKLAKFYKVSIDYIVEMNWD
jgi:transcriptional regulator with XRE-family HTH domain